MTSYPPAFDIIKFSPTCLDTLKKIVLLKLFPIFLKKSFQGNKNFNKKLFLPKYSIDLEQIYQNRVAILIKKVFLPKFIFHQNFLLEKSEKFSTKQFFSTVSKQIGENLIMPSDGGYFVTTRKFL